MKISAVISTNQGDRRIELTGYELGFMRGVFAARGVVEPTEEDYRVALGFYNSTLSSLITAPTRELAELSPGELLPNNALISRG